MVIQNYYYVNHNFEIDKEKVCYICLDPFTNEFNTIGAHTEDPNLHPVHMQCLEDYFTAIRKIEDKCFVCQAPINATPDGINYQTALNNLSDTIKVNYTSVTVRLCGIAGGVFGGSFGPVSGAVGSALGTMMGNITGRLLSTTLASTTEKIIQLAPLGTKAQTLLANTMSAGIFIGNLFAVYQCYNNFSLSPSFEEGQLTQYISGIAGGALSGLFIEANLEDSMKYLRESHFLTLVRAGVGGLVGASLSPSFIVRFSKT